MLKESCVDLFDSMNCNAGVAFCEAEIILPFYRTSRFLATIPRTFKTDVVQRRIPTISAGTVKEN
jgi:hypothetical protein